MTARNLLAKWLQNKQFSLATSCYYRVTDKSLGLTNGALAIHFTAAAHNTHFFLVNGGWQISGLLISLTGVQFESPNWTSLTAFMVLILLKHPSFHPATIFCLSEIGLQRKQIKQGITDILLPGNTFLFLLEEVESADCISHQVLPGLIR